MNALVSWSFNENKIKKFITEENNETLSVSLRVPRQTTRKEIIKRVAVAVQKSSRCIEYWISCLFNNITSVI